MRLPISGLQTLAAAAGFGVRRRLLFLEFELGDFGLQFPNVGVGGLVLLGLVDLGAIISICSLIVAKPNPPVSGLGWLFLKALTKPEEHPLIASVPASKQQGSKGWT